MTTIPIEQLVAEFYSVYKSDKKSGEALVRSTIKEYELPLIELIVLQQRALSETVTKDGFYFSPMKIMFHVMVVLCAVGNSYLMDNNPAVYACLVCSLILPIWDSLSMRGRGKSHAALANVIEQQMPFFRDYHAHKMQVANNNNEIFD